MQKLKDLALINANNRKDKLINGLYSSAISNSKTRHQKLRFQSQSLKMSDGEIQVYEKSTDIQSETRK